MANICNFCRKEYDDEGFNGFCKEECELQSKKSKFTTMSVKHLTRNKLIILQNEILTATNRKIPYSDLIDYLFDITNNILPEKINCSCRSDLPEKLSERIIRENKLFL